MLRKTKEQLADIVNDVLDCEDFKVTEDNIEHLPRSVPNWQVYNKSYDNSAEGREFNEYVDRAVEDLGKGYYLEEGDGSIEWDED